jgi:hypothetical protein
MTDFERRYAALAYEADRVKLAAPETVRRRADRRTRARVGLTLAAVAVLVGGIAAAGQAVLKADSTVVSPGTSPSPSLSTPPSPPPPSSSPSSSPPPPSRTPLSPTQAVPKSIPDRAFLQLADTNGDQRPYSRPSTTMLPPLCGARYASDDQVQVRRTMHIVYWKQRAPTVPDGTFDETITAYRSGGAHRFMDELRTAVTDCPSQVRDGQTYRHRLLSATTYGDESLLFEVRYQALDVNGAPTGGTEVRLVSVVRVGVVVMVLYEQGWEGESAERPVVDAFTRTALTRLRSWLG